jgi:hypothetical protein
MYYRQRSTGTYPCSVADMRQANPYISIPDAVDQATAVSLGFDPVTDTTPPDAPGQVVTEGPPAQQPDATWAQTWVVASVPPPVVPAQISRWQAMQIMLATPSKVNAAPATLLSDVQAIVATTGGVMSLAWANQQFLYRHGPFLSPTLMAAVGLTDADVDALFIAAETLPP